jgi:hypothetical protein
VLCYRHTPLERRTDVEARAKALRQMAHLRKSKEQRVSNADHVAMRRIP